MSGKQMYVLKLSGSTTEHQATWLHDALCRIAVMQKVPIADVYLKVLAQEFIAVKEKKVVNDELTFTFSRHRSRVVALALMNIIQHDIMGTDFVIPIQIVTPKGENFDRQKTNFV